MKALNKISYGLLLGLILPFITALLYLHFSQAQELSIVEIVKRIFPGPIFGKIVILSIIPDLLLIFVFYKFDFFKMASGLLISTLPFVILTILMFS